VKDTYTHIFNRRILKTASIFISFTAKLLLVYPPSSKSKVVKFLVKGIHWKALLYVAHLQECETHTHFEDCCAHPLAKAIVLAAALLVAKGTSGEDVCWGGCELLLPYTHSIPV
jgi:hypothetical protein